MALTVIIQLTTAGGNTGPFDLYSNADGFTTSFESGVILYDLVAGYTSVLVPNNTTIIRVKNSVSNTTCINYIDISLLGVSPSPSITPTVTPTVTPTPTITPTPSVTPPTESEPTISFPAPTFSLKSIIYCDCGTGCLGYLATTVCPEGCIQC